VEHVPQPASPTMSNEEREFLQQHSGVVAARFIANPRPAPARITPLTSRGGDTGPAPTNGAAKESRPRAVKGSSVDMVLDDDLVSNSSELHQQQQWQNRTNALDQQQSLEWDKMYVDFGRNDELALQHGQAAFSARNTNTEFKDRASKEEDKARAINNLLLETQSFQLGLDRRLAGAAAALSSIVGDDLLLIANDIAQKNSFGRTSNLTTEICLLTTTAAHPPVVYGTDSSCSIYCPGPDDPDTFT
jgi:hypothetical protein